MVSPVAATETISTNNHKIQKLKIITNPTKPKVGDAVNISATFTLKSPTGFDGDRLRAYFSRVNGTPLTGSYSFSDINEEAKTASVEFSTTQARTINKNLTEIIFQYLLTSTQVQDEPPLAQKSKFLKASGSSDSGSSGGSGGGNGNGGNSGNNDVNGDPAAVIQAFYLEVDEETTTDIGSVSLEPKKILLRVTHDADLISKVNNGDLFVASLDPVLNALKIKSRKTIVEDGKEKTITTTVTDDFTWNVEKASSASSELSNYLVTEYISDNMTFLEVQKLIFSANLSNHFERTKANVPDDVIVQDQFKYTINPITLNLTGLEINPTTLSFNQNTTDATKGKQLLELTGATMTGNLTTTSLDFNQASYTSAVFGKSSKIKTIKKNTSQKIKPSIDDNRNIVITELDSVNGEYQIELPLEASIIAPKTVFTKSKQSLANSSVDKQIIIPFTIKMKSDSTDNGLEIELTGKLEQEKNIDIETLE